MAKQYDFLIVGAGLFGSVFARQVTEQGYKCLVIDRRKHIAGNAYTELVNGIQVHSYGAHIFHTNDKGVWDYVNRFAAFNDYKHKVLVDYDGRLLSFPINLKTFEQLYGYTSEKQVVEYLNALPKVTTTSNFKTWAIQHIGEELYKTFIEGYTEKQWGRSPADLPSSIIRRIPIRTARNDLYFDDKFQGIPKEGYTTMISNMLKGVEVRLEVDYLENETELRLLAENVVYTGPIDEYFKYKHGALAYRGLKFEHKVLEKDLHQKAAVINYTNREVPYTRIIEHKQFDYKKSNKTIITKEYPQDWEPKDEPYYPINDKLNQSLYSKYKDMSLSENNVIFGGRLAEYKYYDMHQVIASALSKSNEFLDKVK
jgi:UDP-galactopyranose mutase